jgi:hypothetical protein
MARDSFLTAARGKERFLRAFAATGATFAITITI